MRIILFSFIFTFLFSLYCYPQELDIIPYLQKIEKGDKDSVAASLPALKKKYPKNPSLLFLEGVITENGEKAVSFFHEVIQKYPESKYADAALYRIYSYYYSLGFYLTSQETLEKLKNDYPNSPYIRIAEKEIPVEDESYNEKRKKNTEVKGSYSYTIQAGAFSNTENASLLKNEFQQKGYFSEIKEKNVAGTTFFVVYLGKFKTREESEIFLDIINKEYNLKGIIQQIN